MAAPRPGTHNIQAIAFLASAVAGTASIIGLKALGTGQVLVTLAPIAVMAAYAALIIRPYFRARADQLGDNLYYLGFIFTLVSLSTSLVAFATGGAAEEIVSNFGVALATTLLGVSLRVAFNLMRTDPIETEREARLELAEASRRLKVELSNSAAEFNMATRANRQTVADAVQEMSRTVDETLKRVTTSFEATLKQSAINLAMAGTDLEAQMRTATSKLSEASGNLRTVIDKSASDWAEASDSFMGNHRQLNAAAQKLVGSVEKTIARLEAAMAPVDAVEAKLTALSGAADTLAGAIDSAHERAASAGATVEGIVARIGESQERSLAIVESFAATGASAGELVSELRDSQKESTAIVANMAATGAAATEIVESLRAARDRTLEVVESAAAQSAQVAQAAGVFAQAAELVEAAAGQPARLAEVLERLDRRMENETSAIVSGVEAALERGRQESNAARFEAAPFLERLDLLTAEMRGLAQRLGSGHAGSGEASA